MYIDPFFIILKDFLKNKKHFVPILCNMPHAMKKKSKLIFKDTAYVHKKKKIRKRKIDKKIKII